MNALTLTLSRSHRALLSVAIAFAIGGAPAHAGVDLKCRCRDEQDSPPPMDHSAMGTRCRRHRSRHCQWITRPWCTRLPMPSDSRANRFTAD
jgi:hypothetical protein